MAHFAVYNTEDPAAASMGYNEIGNKGEVILQTLQTARSSKIAGSIFSEKAGTVFIEQTFDNGKNWDISAELSVEAEKAKSYEQPIIAPYARARFVSTVNEKIKKFRFYARSAQEQGN